MRWLHRPQHWNSTCAPILGPSGGSVCVKDRADAQREAAEEVFVSPPKRQRVHPFVSGVWHPVRCTSQNKSAVFCASWGNTCSSPQSWVLYLLPFFFFFPPTNFSWLSPSFVFFFGTDYIVHLWWRVNSISRHFNFTSASLKNSEANVVLCCSAAVSWQLQLHVVLQI